ncbi:45306_t:CDS:2, partial [Gigaspora margarita]
LAEVPISNSGIESLTFYENVNVYSKAENPVLYFTNIEEVSTKKKDEKEKNKFLEKEIQDMVNNDKMTLQQQLEIQ